MTQSTNSVAWNTIVSNFWSYNRKKTGYPRVFQHCLVTFKMAEKGSTRTRSSFIDHSRTKLSKPPQHFRRRNSSEISKTRRNECLKGPPVRDRNWVNHRGVPAAAPSPRRATPALMSIHEIRRETASSIIDAGVEKLYFGSATKHRSAGRHTLTYLSPAVVQVEQPNLGNGSLTIETKEARKSVEQP